MAIRLTPPEELQLPAHLEHIGYVDSAMPPGWRCAWAVSWTVFDPRTGGRIIRPSQWRYGDAPGTQLQVLPDELIALELQDIRDRKLSADWTFGRDAALFLSDLTLYRHKAENLIANVRSAPALSEMISPYNPPKRQTFHSHIAQHGWTHDAARGWIRHE
jgi:hypothetical protein